jgi:hypothetical protein
MNKIRQKTEYGDWQTPLGLADEVCALLALQGLQPLSVIEPTSGKGSFLHAAIKSFPSLTEAVGVEINSSYVQAATKLLSTIQKPCKVELIHADFFKVDWEKVIKSLPEPILIIGNPPWVTNTELTTLGSSNLPNKTNFQNHRGIDAITGRSNFDISEWMLLQVLKLMKNRNVTLAMLCKTVVARKLLLKAWQNNSGIGTSSMYRFDAAEYFGASVDACLLVFSSSPALQSSDCRVYESLAQSKPSHLIGYRQNRLIANIGMFEQHGHLLNTGNNGYEWRSGIKHDCSKVMELSQELGYYRNGLGEVVEVEDDFLYPMLKSSDVAKGAPFNFTKKMLVPQRCVGENTNFIRHIAPKTWRYLNKHADLLDRRASSIYNNRPKFSVFGVGEYSFATWKVAISGFYKALNFRAIGPNNGKPVVLDDTCYFIGCDSEDEAICLVQLLNSKIAHDFFSSLIFWDSKRPITVDLLRSLDIKVLAQELNLAERLCGCRNTALQLSLFK